MRAHANQHSHLARILLAAAASTLASCLLTLDEPHYRTADTSQRLLDALDAAEAFRDTAADVTVDRGERLDASTDVPLTDGHVSDDGRIDAAIREVAVDGVIPRDGIVSDVSLDVPTDVFIAIDARVDAGADVPIDAPIDGFVGADVPVDAPIDVFVRADIAVDAGGDVACSTPCGAGIQCCGGRCVNTSTSEANCGRCGFACATSTVCQSGTCATCPLSLGVCLSGGDRCCVIGLCLGLCP